MGVVAAVALAAAGCGSSGATTSATDPTTADATTPATAATATTAEATTSTTTAPRAADVSVGARFDQVCTVVAPPQSDQQATVFNASCPYVPEQYQFVQVQINDPNLRVDPDEAGVRVQGRVFGTATSQLGYRVVEVLATSVTHVANG